MKSPFPGMDPYLEACWGDVHTSLVTYARNQLQRQLPPGLHARVEEHVTLQLTDTGSGQSGRRLSYYPDVRVVERPADAGTQLHSADGGIAVLEPLVVPLAVEEQTQRTVQIIDTRSGNRIITTLEFLSPTNKSDSAGRAAYRRQQEELRQAKVNLVEIVLLREGPYVLTAPAHVVPLTYLAPYRICVVRASRPNEAEIYRASLRERLPEFRIPLREGDADARLDLQELIDKGYEDGRYDAEFDYRVDPIPPLQGDDATWAHALLREKGCR